MNVLFFPTTIHIFQINIRFLLNSFCLHLKNAYYTQGAEAYEEKWFAIIFLCPTVVSLCFIAAKATIQNVF